MPTTATYLLPYPSLTDAPNVPADMQALADRLEVLLAANSALLVDTGWVAMSLSNGWVTFGGAFQTPRYRRLNGVVYVQGFIKSGTTADNTLIYTLPAGFRPAATVRKPSVMNSLTLGAWDVAVDGTIRAAGIVNATQSSFDFSFPADV
jgi:hypothetical protein